MPRQGDAKLARKGRGASVQRGTSTPASGPLTVDVGGNGSSGEVSLGRRFLNPRTALSFAVAFAILFFLATRAQIDFGGTLRAIAGANPAYYLLAVVAYYLVFPVRALRWRRMMANAGFSGAEIPGAGRAAQIIFLSWFANCLVPAKLGDVYRAYLLKRWCGVSGSKAGGTIVGERLLDLATLLLLAAGAGLVAVRGQPGDRLAVLLGPLEILSVVVVLAAVAILSMRLWSAWLHGLLPARVRGLYARFAEGAVGSFGAFQVLLPYSLLAWLCEALRLFLVVRALGIVVAPDPIAELAVVTAVSLVGSLLTALPLTPAGLGFVESGLVGALLLVGVPDRGQALSIAVLDRTISWASLVVVGIVVYLASARVPTRRAAPSDESPDRA